ncbi:hypothetical protein DEJ36_16640 [Curtobacterium sp. MCPF17_052]|nr:hypothetical protein [Curtobacterium sp. MCPF17_052]WIB12315.1 hypothetical protein DEJ36_16640 [Curtobacterium sp. MCPF17_052]
MQLPRREPLDASLLAQGPQHRVGEPFALVDERPRQSPVTVDGITDLQDRQLAVDDGQDRGVDRHGGVRVFRQTLAARVAVLGVSHGQEFTRTCANHQTRARSG